MRRFALLLPCMLALLGGGSAHAQTSESDLVGEFDALIEQRTFPVYDTPASDPRWRSFVFYQGMSVQIAARISNRSDESALRVVAPAVDPFTLRWLMAPAGGPEAPDAISSLASLAARSPDGDTRAPLGVEIQLPVFGVLDTTFTIHTQALPEGLYELYFQPSPQWQAGDELVYGEQTVRFEIREPNTPRRRLESARIRAEWALAFEARRAAEAAAKEMLEIDPDSFAAYRLLAMVAEGDGNAVLAEEYWQRAEALEDTDPMLP